MRCMGASRPPVGVGVSCGSKACAVDFFLWQ